MASRPPARRGNDARAVGQHHEPGPGARRPLRQNRQQQRRPWRAGAGAVGVDAWPYNHSRCLAVARGAEFGRRHPESDAVGGLLVRAAARAGTLSVSTGSLKLVSVSGTATGRFTLTANGGPVSAYSITAGPTLAGSISVSPSSGSLASGASVTITVTSTSLVALDGQLTVNPGGRTITVVLTVSL